MSSGIYKKIDLWRNLMYNGLNIERRFPYDIRADNKGIQRDKQHEYG